MEDIHTDNNLYLPWFLVIIYPRPGGAGMRAGMEIPDWSGSTGSGGQCSGGQSGQHLQLSQTFVFHLQQ